MKKLISFIALAIISISLYAQNEPAFNDDNIFVYKEVVEYGKVSTDEIFVKAHEMLSDWSYNKNSKNSIELSDNETGTIISKCSIFLGFTKASMFYGWDVFADCSLTIRIKPEKYQITVKVPSLTFKWSANGHEYTTPFSDVYPEYKAKVDLKNHKKACQAWAPTVPEVMKTIVDSVKKKLKVEDDDF